MIEEDVELLSPGNPNLTDPRQCAYREGREHHKSKIKPKKMLEMIENNPFAIMNKSTMHSFETIFCFTSGINGKPLEKNGCKDYCEERCNIVSCEYNTKKITLKS